MGWCGVDVRVMVGWCRVYMSIDVRVATLMWDSVRVKMV